MSAPGPLLVGIDVGTTRIKAGIVDEAGNERSSYAVPTRWQLVASGAEIDPEDLLAAVVTVASRALEAAPPGPIAGVGVTSVAETVVLADAEGAALCPAPAWHDVRAQEDYAAFRRDLGAARIGAVTGLGTAQTPTVATLRWLFAKVPAARRAVWALSVAEWVVLRLGGEALAEASLASRTGAFDVAGRRWWPEALAWAGAPDSLFPPVRTAGARFGRVGAAFPGLRRARGAALTVAGHDHLCAAVGIGATATDQVVDSCGTAEAVLRAVPVEPGRDRGAGLAYGIQTGCHVLEGYEALLGGISLGLGLAPVLDVLGLQSDKGETALDERAAALVNAPPARAPMEELFVPPGRGAEEARIALAMGASPARVWRDAVAAVVGRSLSLVEGLEALGGPVAEVRLSGGWARNPLLWKLKASCFPPMRASLVREGGVRGAALLAGLASGIYEGPSALPPASVADLAGTAPDSFVP